MHTHEFLDNAMSNFSAFSTQQGEMNFRREQKQKQEFLKQNGQSIQKMKLLAPEKLKGQKWLCVVDYEGNIVKLVRRVFL